MKLHRMSIMVAIAMTSLSCILTAMDLPKLVADQNITFKWVYLVKKILLDQIALPTESSYDLEESFFSLNDGKNSFKLLPDKQQKTIIDLLKLYMSGGDQLNHKALTLQDTLTILHNLTETNIQLKNIFSDSFFCRQLIKLLAKKLNQPETIVGEKMKLGASQEIVLGQNLLLSLCCSNDYSEKEFEEALHALMKEFDDLDINYTYVDLKTPLMLAITTGNLSFVRPLIKAGADRFMKTKNGDTALNLLDLHYPNPGGILNMPMEYNIALKTLMEKKYR